MMKLLGGKRRFCFAGVLAGLFLLTGVLQADVTTTWTIHNGDLYIGDYPFPAADLTGSFTFDSTADAITSMNMVVNDYYFEYDLGGFPIPFTMHFGGNSTGLEAGGDFGCPCGFGLTFLQPLTSAGGTVGIDPTMSGYGADWWGEEGLYFQGAYVTSPEPSVPAQIFLSALGMIGLVYVRRRRRATRVG